ncbi:NADH-dependent phenylglyoxylate dehydrogenase subunit alpha [Magnetospirillum sp. LM-5]|uniref:NADH-dependent phenylglyoxylate dehydrogenase subunit alpha n=1 Tax=Magnetospirillum sp. LM-5 TaxID=2681466 RepID=UPI00137F1023|nr:transketolase C-terminal domain-containing protein [Magnetospirillum sp. LM-5]CAA7625974.1 NADH-dependent phenylglyoxylate dehydrogenase subunit alpha [Magnetospirillum sp. LM-5]
MSAPATLKATSRTMVIDGNEAAAWGAALSRPDVVAVYPITPQSSLVEYLAKFIAEGKMDAELMDVEGEHSVLSVLHGACLAGGRTYSATSAQGLAYMFEPYFRTPGLRLPMVVSLVTRDSVTPCCVWGGQQDAMTVKEVGWIQMYCETQQEICDSIPIAYKVAEHADVMLPVNVCHDGNYLSYGVARVDLPEQEVVDAFLGEKNVNWHACLDPERPMAVDPLTGGAGGIGPSTFVRYRKGQCAGMASALDVIVAAHEDWGRRTGRYWSPLIEEYRMEDAEVALVTIGSMTGAAKDAVDDARLDGRKVGLVKIKTFRPFPAKVIAKALSKVKAVGVVDRAVNFGWNCGPVFQEVLAALYANPTRVPLISFIGGLAGADITPEHFGRAIADTVRVAAGETMSSPIWLNEFDQ